MAVSKFLPDQGRSTQYAEHMNLILFWIELLVSSRETRLYGELLSGAARPNY